MTPEERLLLRCVRCLILDEAVADIPSVDWDRVYRLGSANNLLPILSTVVPMDTIPTETAEKIEYDIRRRRMRTAVMLEEFQAIHAKLSTSGISVMPIKGVVLSQQIYPSPSQRYFDDIDLLVRPENGQRALRTLEQMGYIAHPNAPQAEWHHLTPYLHRKRGVMVEIHVDLYRRARKGWEVDDVWERAKRVKLGDVETWLMSDGDALVNTALHARHNLFNRLSFMTDGALLARQVSSKESSPDYLAKLAAEAGAVCALEYTMKTASRLFELEDLPHFRGRLSGLWFAEHIASWDSLASRNDSLRQGPLPRILELLMMDSASDRLLMAGRLIAPPRSFVGNEDGQQRTVWARYSNRLWRRTHLGARQLMSVIQRKIRG